MIASPSLSTRFDVPDVGSEEKAHDLFALLNIAKAMSAMRDVRGLMNLIVYEAGQILDADRVSLYLLDKDSGEIWTWITTGAEIREKVKEIRLPAGEGIAGYVALSKEMVNIEDAYDDPRFSREWDQKTGYRTKSMLCAPLLTQKGEVVGVIQALNKRSGAFTGYDEELFSALAAHSAIELENTLLYSELEKAHDELGQAFRDLESKNDIVLDAHDRLVRNEKLASLGQLSAAVAHEMTNPLSVIAGYAQLIEKRADNADGVRKYAEMIQKQIEEVTRIMRQLLSFSRRSDAETELHSANAIIEDTLVITEHYLSRFKDVSVERRLAEKLPPIKVDKGQIQQVFVNMIMNAAQAMPEGGELSISSSLELRDFGGKSDRGVGATAQQPFVCLEFQDTGVGIPKDKLDKIFEAFFTTKKNGDGTGLGLSICSEIVKAHNGRIEVESKVSEGTSFLILIPAALS